MMKNDCPFLIKLHGANFSEGKINVALEYMNWGTLGGLVYKLEKRVEKNFEKYYVP